MWLLSNFDFLLISNCDFYHLRSYLTEENDGYFVNERRNIDCLLFFFPPWQKQDIQIATEKKSYNNKTCIDKDLNTNVHPLPSTLIIHCRLLSSFNSPSTIQTCFFYFLLLFSLIACCLWCLISHQSVSRVLISRLAGGCCSVDQIPCN